MGLCFPYRYLIAGLAGLGLCNPLCMRQSFTLMVTHTLRPATSSVSNVSIYPHCTVFNTSRDYISDFHPDTSMQFHTVYYVGIVVGIMLGGFLSGRFPAHIVIGIAIFTCSVLALILPQVYKLTSAGVFIIRFVQGLNEGVSQASMPGLICSWALVHETSTLFAITFSAFQLSPGIATIVAGACLCYISWDSAMYLFGATGVLWSAAWAWLSYSVPQECPHLGKEELLLQITKGHVVHKGSSSLAARIPWKKILTSKAVWAIWMGCFCKNFIVSTVTTLQPQFFKDIFGIRSADIGLLLALPYFTALIFMYVYSYAADRLITSKLISTTKVRKFFQCVGAIIESVFFVGMIYASSWQMSFAFLTVAYAAGAMTFAGYNCNIVDLSPQFSGAVSAIVFTGISGGAITTFIASLVPGKESTFQNWTVVFWLEVAIAACTALVFLLFASGETQSWEVECESTEITVLPCHTSDDGKQLLENGHVNKDKRTLYTGDETFGMAEKNEQKSS